MRVLDSNLWSLKDEVASALAKGSAVVALESTVIAHGLPQPQNLETALHLEEIVRECGAMPATIALLDGKLCVGLTSDQLRHIATGVNIKKVSRRDLPVAIARGWDGATTVSTTLWIAHRADIQVMATGGIGGVHRSETQDVSADLPELARTPMTVVCSGVKIVLDIPATREWLETNGITVVGYECDEMPAFYSRQSGLQTDARANSAGEVAEIAFARNQLGMEGAILLTVPVPATAAIALELVQQMVDDALGEARGKHIGGRDLTPFLLTRMAQRSGGATLEANIALLENNARIAAEVAIALAS